MTVKNDVMPRARYVSTGTVVPWPFDWALFSDDFSDLIVEYDDVPQVGGYTVSYDAVNESGSVTPDAALPAGTIIVLRRQTKIERRANYVGIGDFRAPVVNFEADRVLAIQQEHAEKLSRVAMRSPSSGSTADLTLPAPASNRGLKWNADESGLENSDRDLDALGDAVEADRTAAETARAATEAALSQVQSLVVTAQNSAAASEAAAQSIPQGMVKRISSDYTVPVSENGYHYVLDGTSGTVTLTAPLGSDAGEPFRFSCQRTDSSDNAVKVVASGDNTFNNGQTEIVLPYASSGVSLALDIDPEPDNWGVATSGALSQLQEKVFYFTATAGQTVFSGADDFGNVLGYVPGKVEVFHPERIWGARADYTDADGLSIVLAKGAQAGEKITIVARSAFSVADTLTTAEIKNLINQKKPPFFAYVKNSVRKTYVPGKDYIVSLDDGTRPLVTEGIEVAGLIITPDYAGQAIEVYGETLLSTNTSGFLYAAIYDERGTILGIDTQYIPRSSSTSFKPWTVITAASTDPLTFTMSVGANRGLLTINVQNESISGFDAFDLDDGGKGFGSYTTTLIAKGH